MSNFRGFGAVVANADALFMARRRGLPVRQRQVSAELRAWRKKAGLTCADVARALGTSITKISRMETGERGLYPDDVAAMLGFLKVPQKPRQELLDLVRNGGDPSWWQMRPEDWGPAWKDLISIESDAIAIANFETMLLPGLLQTAEYITALCRGLDDRLSEADINGMVATRLGRQALLTKRDAPTLHAIFDEMVLRRPIGAPGVLRRQLEHLVTCASRPNINMQVVPVLAGATPAWKGPLLIIDLEDSGCVVHVEAYVGGGFFTEEPLVREAKRVWQQLCAVALPPEQSVALIAAIAGELPTGRDPAGRRSW